MLENFTFNGIEALKNDFETSVFQAYPLIEMLKINLYKAGAIYAAMSGSGSSVFGIFETEPSLSEDLDAQIIYNGQWSY